MPLFTKRFVPAFLSVFLLICAGFTLDIPPSPSQRVNDWASMFRPETRSDLENNLALLEDKTGDQTVIATFPSLQGEDIEDFSIRLSDKWKIGHKGRDNGIIILIFRDEHQARIEVGYGLETVIPDITAGRIIRDILVPSFRQGDFDGGIEKTVEVISSILEGTTNSREIESSAPGMAITAKEISLKNMALKILLIAACLLLFFFIIDSLRYTGYYRANKSYSHRYNFFEWLLIFSITLFILKLIFQLAFFSSMRDGFGGGRGGFGSSGGFSGGGGSFGGGGASGSW